MGWRFRKSIKLMPGVRLNLSKTGVSTSIGRPGATVNIRGRRVRGTVGIPGSGVSYSEETHIGGADMRKPDAPAAKTLGRRLLVLIFRSGESGQR